MTSRAAGPRPVSWACFTSVALLRFSALHHAALTGTTELLSALLEAQATVDIKDSNGWSLTPALTSEPDADP